MLWITFGELLLKVINLGAKLVWIGCGKVIWGKILDFLDLAAIEWNG